MGRVLEANLMGDFLGPLVCDESATGCAHLEVGQPLLRGYIPPTANVVAHALRSLVDDLGQCLDSIACLFGQWFPIRDSIQIIFHVCSGPRFPAMNTRDVGRLFHKIEFLRSF